MKALAFFPAAVRDLEAIWDYSASHWGTAQAQRYTRELYAACEDLAVGRAKGRTSVLPPLQKLLCQRHVIYFQDGDERIDIVRILHQSQDAQRHL